MTGPIEPRGEERRTPMRSPAAEAGGWALVSVLLENRKLLWRYPLLITVIVVAIAFLFPNVYRSTVTILPPESGFQSTSQSLGGLKGLFTADMSLPIMATPSDVLATVLGSRTVRDSVVTRLDLASRWDKTASKAASQLYASTSVDVDDIGILRVSATDYDRFFCDTLVNVLVDAADRVNRIIANTKARRTREFIEGRLQETRVMLADAANALEQFQNKHRTVALDVEIAALVENAATLRARLTADEIELSILEGSLSPEHHRIRALQRGISETSRMLKELESPSDSDTTPMFLGMGLAELPRLAQELAVLIRDVRVAETLYELLVEQYENARIQERRDTPTFSVLDWAVGGGTKARPRRLTIGFGVLVSSFGLTVLFVLGRAYLVNLERNDPERFRMIMSIRDALRLSRRRRSTT